MNILAIDPGTHCGYAVRMDSGSIFSGVWDLQPRRHEGGGMRFLRLRTYLVDVLTDIGMVVYEEVRGHKGTDAAQIYGGIVAIITQVCEYRQLPYSGIPVGTIKKFATGKGNADKPAMIATAKRKWPEFDGDDNEADARWLAEYAAQEVSHV